MRLCFYMISIKDGLTLLIDLVKQPLKVNLYTLTNMTEDELFSNNERQLSYQARYDRIELKELGRTVLVQYYVCSSNIPCVRVLGYIQERSTAKTRAELRFANELHLPAKLTPIPERHKWVIRRYVMANTAARLSIDAPLVHF
jgi:hypothetical protein